MHTARSTDFALHPVRVGITEKLLATLSSLEKPDPKAGNKVQ